jgi:hypothetical protein
MAMEEITTGDIPADRVLQAAVGQLKSVVVCGETESGDIWAASSLGDGEESKRLIREWHKQHRAAVSPGEA